MGISSLTAHNSFRDVSMWVLTNTSNLGVTLFGYIWCSFLCHPQSSYNEHVLICFNFFKKDQCHSLFKNAQGLNEEPKCQAAADAWEWCLAQPHRGLKAMDHIKKIKATVFFRLIASLSHTSLCSELLKLTNLSVTSFFSSIHSESVAKKQWKEVCGVGGCVTCVGNMKLSRNLPSPPFPSATSDNLRMGKVMNSLTPFHRLGNWGKIKSLCKISQQESGKMLPSSPRAWRHKLQI